MMMEITNEARDGLSAAQMYANYVTYAQQAKVTYGLTVIMATCPAGKLTGDPADTITRQLACRDLILASPTLGGYCDAIINFGGAPNYDTQAGITNSSIYNVDQLHFTDLGYDGLASIAAPVIQQYT
jgi:hypothetical protein